MNVDGLGMGIMYLKLKIGSRQRLRNTYGVRCQAGEGSFLLIMAS